MRVLASIAGGLVSVLWFVLRVLVHGWATLAIYFSNLPSPLARTALASAFFVFGIWALWIARRRRAALVAYAALYAGVLAWWATILPSHDRAWRPEVAVMPRAYVDGDRVRITGVRDFSYRSRDDFTPRYIEREVSLSRLTGVDFYISYWVPGPIGHTFVSFVFDNEPPLSVSIETRPEVGEGYSPLASMFKHFELIYVVGTERDIIGVRTNYRDEDVYLYRIRVSPENARRLFLIYLERINELADRPEWYHLLSNSCTINIIRYANLSGRVGGLDIRHVLNGWIDRYFFETGYVDNRLPFAELRRRSQINAAARAADSDRDFSERIRAGLPTIRR